MQIEGAKAGVWCGIEFDSPRGTNDGEAYGKRYFQCAWKHGIFVPKDKVKTVLAPAGGVDGDVLNVPEPLEPLSSSLSPSASIMHSIELTEHAVCLFASCMTPTHLPEHIDAQHQFRDKLILQLLETCKTEKAVTTRVIDITRGMVCLRLSASC